RGPGVVPPARRRDGAAYPGGRKGARRADPCRRDLPAAATRAALAAARRRLDRAGDRAPAPGARGRRPDVVLRGLQREGVRGILPPRRHRAGLLPRVREFLPLRRTAHVQSLWAPQSAPDALRNAGRLPGRHHLIRPAHRGSGHGRDRPRTAACSRSTSTPITFPATGPTSRASTVTSASPSSTTPRTAATASTRTGAS